MAGLLSILLYSRLKREDVLDHFVRGQIYGHIRTNLGTHYNEIRRTLGVANGVLAFHLHTLEREGFVRALRVGSRKHFYPTDAPLPDERGVRLSDIQQRILDHARANPGTPQAAMADALGVPRQSLNYNVKQLARMGQLKLEEAGRVTRCYVVEAPAPPATGEGEPGPPSDLPR